MSKEIESLFVPYEQSLQLRDLGFDEKCLANLIGFGDGSSENGKYNIKHQEVFYPDDYISSEDKAEELKLHSFFICGVPLYTQAFKWFRDNYPELDFGIGKIYNGTNNYHYHINLEWEFFGGTYEEAELECLKKLISIVKNV